MLKSKTVLITGAGGVLGQEIISQLLVNDEFDYRIFALELTADRIPENYLDNPQIASFDIRQWEMGQIALDKIDTIVHCAFARSSSGKLLARSLKFTKGLLEGAVKNKVSSVINISSQSVYDRSIKPLWTEESPVAPGPPDTFYALAKYSSELLTSAICKSKDSNTVGTSLRLASLVGEGMEERLPSRFVRSVLEGKPIKLIGGQQSMAYMDVRDAAAGIMALIQTDTLRWKDIYNLGSKQCYTIKEIAEEVARQGKFYGKEVIIKIEEKDVYLDSGMDSSLFYKDTGWTPKYDLKAIIDFLFINAVGVGSKRGFD